MAVRITDLTTASAIEADDYVVIDGATEGTRKVLASDMGGGDDMIDFTTSYTSASLDSRGVGGNLYNITPVDSTVLTAANALKISAYLLTSGYKVYPLIIVYSYYGSSYFTIYVKCLESSVQNTSTATVSGALHIVAPFEISSVNITM